MSKPTTPSNPSSLQSVSALKPSASAWARGPPSASGTPSQSAVNSTAASPNGTPHLAQAPLPAVNKDLSNASAGKSTTAPNAARPQHSRKSSLLAVGANASAAAGPSATSTDSAIPAKPMNIGGRGINFGSVSNPNAELSSSPAANPTTGTHLASTDGVKSFGTVEAADAGKEDKSAVLSRKPAQASNPKFDVNKLFQMPGAAGSSPVVQQARGYDAQGRPVQMGGNSMPPTGAANRLNPQMSPSAGAPSSPGVPNQNPRSPTLGHQQSNSMNPYGNSPGASFRPSNIQSGSVRGPPNQMPGQVNRGQSAHNFGMHPNQQQNYPGMPYGGPQGYYAYGYYGPDSPYGPGPGPVQWQAGQGSTPLSPRAGNATPHNSSGTQHAPSTPGMNGAGGQSMPAANRPSASHNPSNFSSSSQTSGPSTPSQSHARPASFQPGQPFTPGHMSSPSANLHASANAFVPRTKSSAIKITRADGTAVDLATAAKELKTPTPTGGSSASAGGAPGTPVPASTKPNLPAMPVVVRMETEAQKAQRLSDQEAAKTRKAREEKEEKERRERETARREKEEREAVDTKEREEAEVKQKAEEAERIAKEEAATQAAEQKAKEEESARSAAAAEEKKKDEETREQEARQEESERQALKETEKSTVETETDSKSKTPAGLPSKPSAEVLDSARASPAAPALAPPSDGRTSNSPSPVVSPSMAHATLPAKPVAAGSALARKSTPSALNLPASDESSSQQSNAASAQALLTAKPIEKLEDIQYPDGLNSPNVALNTTAQPGKFRYDRDFLLQFMNVCRDKPESLPPLDQLGMERDHASMGRGGSSRGGQRSGSQMGNPRGAGGMGAGIGGGMGSFGGKNAGGMGSFSMGNFNRPPATSEERMAQSRIGNMGNAFGSARNAPGMARTPSQSGPSGMAMMTPGMGRETSRAGSTRGKQRRAEPRGAPSMGSGQFEADVAPLELSANRWTPGVQSRRPGAVDESSPEYVERKVKGLLNKLTKEKFISISDQILEWGNKSVAESDGQTLRLVIKLIFEKAKDEQFWSSMYAELCHKLLETLSPEIKDEQVKAVDGTPLAGGVLFRKYLLNRCQEDFERGWKNKEDASAAAKNKASEDEKNKAAHAEAVAAGKQVEEFKFSDEYYAEQAAKRQGLGLVKFVGELFKLDMLSLKIMNACIVKLLHNIVTPDEEDVESLCQLISTVGGKIQRTSPTAASTLGIFISRMTEMKESPHISSRMKFMLLEVIESYNNGWKSRAGQGQSGPMTIEEVHRQAAKEQADAARAAANAPMSRDASMSRGGSRRGDQRSGYGGMPGASDQWQSVGSRPPPKAADMTGFGKIQIGGGPGTFGPASVFNRNKSKPKSGDVTPPNGVAATNANPFSALGMDDGSGDVSVAEDSSAGSSEPGPQRKRLVLQPRTVSSANVNADANTDAEADAGDSTEAAEGVTSTDEIERKIKADLAEFWGEKGTVGTRNTDDVVSYFEGLSEEGRLELAKRLVDDLFRLSRAEDTSLVAEAFSKSADAGFLTSETIKAALMPSMELLDDVVVDVPLAYAFAAEIITAGKLSADDVEELGDAIEVLGEVSPLPKDKLKTQVEKLQG